MLFSDLTYDTYNKDFMDSFKCVYQFDATNIHYMEFRL